MSALLLAGICFSTEARAAELPPAWHDGIFSWQASQPLLGVGPGRDALDPHIAIKDPSIVFFGKRWQVFATVMTREGHVGIEYFSFGNWTEADNARRRVLDLGGRNYAAPEVFYFTPHRRWYLIYQAREPGRRPDFRPCFSTSNDPTDPKSWTKAQPMMLWNPDGKISLDFWVICDAQKAHLFYTTQDGRIWRRETRIGDFPLGWSEAILAMQGDFFEASHTYKLKDHEQFLTLVEAQGRGRRYYKAYLADRLEGPWRGLADTITKPFAALENVRQSPAWTANISHGELFRTGVNERLEVDPSNLSFLFQGVSDADSRGSKYHDIPWKLGILKMTK